MDLNARHDGAVYRIAPEEMVRSAEVLATAFSGDPFADFLLGGNASHERLKKLFLFLLRVDAPCGACFRTSGFESVVSWRPPSHAEIVWWRNLRYTPEFLRVFGADAFRVLDAMNVLERARPREPHWYLHVIGTDPQHAGRGYGGMLIRDRLFTPDVRGFPVYLESSKKENLKFYRSLGFEERGVIMVPRGPTLYSMWRRAKKMAPVKNL